jgi:hypothetical protein
MTAPISDTAPRIQYTVAGTPTSAFTVPFEFFDAADLKVYVGTTLKTLTSDYSVSGGSGASGAIALSVAVSSTTVTIVRDIPITRASNFPLTGPFNIASLNTDLNKHAAIMQQQESEMSRSLKLPDTDADGTMTLPDLASRTSKFLAFDADGDAIASAGSVGDTPVVVSSFMATVLDDTTAAAARTTLGAAGTTAASTTASGIVELATTAETTTGTDATRAVTPDGLHDMTSLAGAAWFLDEDAMGTNSATKVASQQSIKAYVTSAVAAAPAGRVKLVDNEWSSGTPSSVTFEDADGMDWGTYSYFEMELSGLISASCRLICTMSQSGAYEIGSTDYHSANVGQQFSATFYNGTTGINIPNVSNEIYKGSAQYNEMFHMRATLYPGLSDGTNIDGPYIYWSLQASKTTSGNRGHANGSGALRNLDATLIDGIKFEQNTGNMANGSFKVWGIV